MIIEVLRSESALQQHRRHYGSYEGNVRDVIQQVMEVEMDEELGRGRCRRSGSDIPNYRNGYSQKVNIQLGEIDQFTLRCKISRI